MGASHLHIVSTPCQKRQDNWGGIFVLVLESRNCRSCRNYRNCRWLAPRTTHHAVITAKHVDAASPPRARRPIPHAAGTPRLLRLHIQERQWPYRGDAWAGMAVRTGDRGQGTGDRSTWNDRANRIIRVCRFYRFYRKPLEPLAKASWHGRPAHETRARCPCHVCLQGFCKRLTSYAPPETAGIPCGGSPVTPRSGVTGTARTTCARRNSPHRKSAEICDICG